MLRVEEHLYLRFKHEKCLSEQFILRVGTDECFFFFQAEDGIRDYKVTGVQTCALPILRLCPERRCWRLRETQRQNHALRGAGGRESLPKLSARGERPRRSQLFAFQRQHRTEERRVGEKGRTRWAPDH